MSTSIYADTSLLASLYLFDANTPAAIKAVAATGRSLILTSWQEFELENALQLRLFRQESSRADLHSAQVRLQQDLSAGAVVATILPIEAVLSSARQLSAKHTGRIGTRAFDVFHVAAAVVLKASAFLSFDVRQLTLAGAAGLRLVTAGR